MQWFSIFLQCFFVGLHCSVYVMDIGIIFVFVFCAPIDVVLEVYKVIGVVSLLKFTISIPIDICTELSFDVAKVLIQVWVVLA